MATATQTFYNNYVNTLGREPSADELTYWTQRAYTIGAEQAQREFAYGAAQEQAGAPTATNALIAQPTAAAPAASKEWLTAADFPADLRPDEGGPTDYSRADIRNGLATLDNWVELAPQLGFQGQIETTYIGPDGNQYPTYTQEFSNFVQQKKNEGYDFVIKAADVNNQNKTVGLQTPTGEVIGQTTSKTGGFEEVVTKFVLPAVAAYFGVQALGTLMGAGGTAGGAGAAGGTAGGAGAAGAGAVDYSVASAAGATPFGPQLASTGVPGAIDYSLATQPVYGSGAGLGLGTAPVIGTGAGLAIAPGVSPVLGNPTSFINQPANLPPTVAVPGVVPGTTVPITVPGVTPSVTPSVTPGVTPSVTPGVTPGAPGVPGGTTPGINLPGGDIWGPLLSTLGSLYGGEQMASATRDAARLQSEAANRAIALQEQMYREGVERQRPFLEEGTAAFNRLAALQRGGPEAAQNFLSMDPGYGFRMGEGMKALERTQAARGNLLSGGAIKGGQRYAQDYASQEYQNAYNRLAQMAGIGPQAAGVANTLGQNFATNVGNLTTQQGVGSANALLAGAAARQSAYGNIGEAWGRYFAPQPTINYLGGRP